MIDLLLELFSEEIPARMQAGAIKQLHDAILAELVQLRIVHGAVQQFVTPRRLAVIVKDLPDLQPDVTIEKKGPKLNAPEAAIAGFCKSANVERNDLQMAGEGKDAHYVHVAQLKGQAVAHILPEIINKIIANFHWPKSMRSSGGRSSAILSSGGRSSSIQTNVELLQEAEQVWVRPLRGIICLLGDEILPVEYAGVQAGRTSFGHRFMAGEELYIANANQYQAKLRAAYVIADAQERKANIEAQLHEAAGNHGLVLHQDDGLLDEVTGLVEYPVVMIGSFDAAYLRLPPEVLVLEMRNHQKYFALKNKMGEVVNKFAVVANIAANDGGTAIAAGNERVLKARLEDGAFYYEQDLKKPLDVWAEGLKAVIFHQKLGSVAQKIERIKHLAKHVVKFVPDADIEKTLRAASLCKADLTTGMVGEFPELQGIIGRYYALAQGEDEAVAEAIKQHYQPLGANDDVPTAPISVVIALADKLDSMAGLFAVGEFPTGSKDPFALRRAALGVIRIIRAHGLQLSLKDTLQVAIIQITNSQELAQPLVEKLYQFMLERLKVALRDDGMRYDAIEAILHDDNQYDINYLIMRINVLDGFLQTEAGANVLAAYKRASNILKKEEQKDKVKYDGRFDVVKLQQSEEIGLVEAIKSVEMRVQELLQADFFADAMHAICQLRPQLEAFFANVTVNADDNELRVNRLNILATVRNMLHQVADFSQLEG